MAAGQKELKGRIDSVSNTQKITDAMKLVAAAKVRRAQDAVINGRPFAENLVKVCCTSLFRIRRSLILILPAFFFQITNAILCSQLTAKSNQKIVLSMLSLLPALSVHCQPCRCSLA